MTDNAQGFYVEYKPTLGERIAKKLGYKIHLGEEPKDADLMLGWMHSEIHTVLSVTDRLRLLMSGKFKLSFIQYTDVQIKESKNRVDLYIVPPKILRR